MHFQPAPSFPQSLISQLSALLANTNNVADLIDPLVNTLHSQFGNASLHLQLADLHASAGTRRRTRSTEPKLVFSRPIGNFQHPSGWLEVELFELPLHSHSMILLLDTVANMLSLYMSRHELQTRQSQLQQQHEYLRLEIQEHVLLSRASGILAAGLGLPIHSAANWLKDEAQRRGSSLLELAGGLLQYQQKLRQPHSRPRPGKPLWTLRETA
jgi:hypothetical protein